MEKKEKEAKHSHRRRHHRHHARDTIQSAVQLQHPFSFENYNPLRRSHHHHQHEPNRDPEPAAEQQEQEPQKPKFSPEVENADRPIRRLVNPETIARERKLRERRQDQVLEALNALSRDAHTATRRLDDTYYSLLEKGATLKATITSIQDLHTCVDEAQKDFAKESDALAKDVTSQIDAFGQFSQQDETIDGLVTRLHNAKTRAQSFESRLESCRSRLELWERKEREKRKRNNRRWALALTAISAFVILIIALVTWKKGAVPSPKHLLRIPHDNKTAPGIRLTDSRTEKQHAKEDARWQKLLDEL